jgi:nitrite reductase/ring-hydroxylating ferredoxin subunit
VTNCSSAQSGQSMSRLDATGRIPAAFAPLLATSECVRIARHLETVRGVDGFAVGHGRGQYLAVSRQCPHLGADLADGTVGDGCLVCCRRHAAYDIDCERMTRGPRGSYWKVPGLRPGMKSLTSVPLRRRRVVKCRGRLFPETGVGGGRRRA